MNGCLQPDIRVHEMGHEEVSDTKMAQKLHRTCRAQGLKVLQVRPGLHEAAEDIACRPVYRIALERQPSRVRAALSWLFRSTVRCVKLPPERVVLSPEAASCYATARSMPETQEIAVFLDTELVDHRLRAMLAVHVGDRWYSLHRWSTSWKGLGLSRHDICRI
jgi:hypothetical protein